MRVSDIRIIHRIVGTKHVFTSPDVPELHVSHADRATAEADIQPALDVLERVHIRLKDFKVNKTIRICEHAIFSTGNGGAAMKVVRESYGEADEYPRFIMVNEISHYGLTQSGETAIHDLDVLDEMIALLGRARVTMAAEQVRAGYPGNARITREVVDSVPVVHPESDEFAIPGDLEARDEQSEVKEPGFFKRLFGKKPAPGPNDKGPPPVSAT